MTGAGETGIFIEHLFRHLAGRVVARLTRLFGPAHVVLAEESVQEAMPRALQTWPYQGIPDNGALSSALFAAQEKLRPVRLRISDKN